MFIIMKYCLDANALISPWYIDYPKNIFPSLWEKLAEFKSKLILIKPIYDEIEPVTSTDQKELSDEKK